MRPELVSYGSQKKVWWKCNKCGNEWEAVIYSRISGSGCPKCGRDKVTESRSKKVLQYSLDGNLIAEYKSASVAAQKTGIKHISCVCRGVRNMAGGYIWKYKKDGD